MQNGMMFGGEGPIMSGNWYNPDTGDAFTVRDSFFEDNQYVVVTTDGRYMKYDQLQRYVSSDMKLEELKRLKTENKEKKNEQLPESVLSILDDESNDSYSDLMIPEDNILTQPVKSQLGNLYKDQPSPSALITSKEVQSHISMNHAIIEKALKNTDGPKLSIVLNWDNYPERQIEMLNDIMEISTDEIIEWYLNNISMIDVIEEFKAAISSRISKKTNDAVEYINPKPEPTKSRKKSK